MEDHGAWRALGGEAWPVPLRRGPCLRYSARLCEVQLAFDPGFPPGDWLDVPRCELRQERLRPSGRGSPFAVSLPRCGTCC